MLPWLARDTRCHEEPNRAAMIAGTMPAYSPYSGGIPAMVAKATPCGGTTMAPVRGSEQVIAQRLPVDPR